MRGRGARGATKPRVLDLLAIPEMRRIYWVNMITASSWDLFIVMLPVLRWLGYSASVIGTVFSLFALGTFLARGLRCPGCRNAANEWQILPGVAGPWWCVFSSRCRGPWSPAADDARTDFGAAVGMSQPNLLSLLHAASPPAAVAGGRLRSVLSNSVSVVVPVAFGAVVAPLGISALLFAGSAVFATGLASAHRGATVRAAAQPGSVRGQAPAPPRLPHASTACHAGRSNFDSKSRPVPGNGLMLSYNQGRTLCE